MATAQSMVPGIAHNRANSPPGETPSAPSGRHANRVPKHYSADDLKHAKIPLIPSFFLMILMRRSGIFILQSCHHRMRTVKQYPRSIRPNPSSRMPWPFHRPPPLPGNRNGQM